MFIDNTGLHSVGRCLEDNHRGEIDAKGLLQFAIELVFANQIVVSRFEDTPIRTNSRRIISQLRRLGVGRDILNSVGFSAPSYAKVCRTAADNLLDELDYVFSSSALQIETLAATRPDGRIPETEQLLSNLALGKCDSAGLETARSPKLPRKAASSIGYMVASNDRLLKQIRATASKKWTAESAIELAACLRFYANQELARAKESIYTPAVARAELVRHNNQLFSERLSNVVEDAAESLGSQRLGIPAVAGVILSRSKGDPKGVISEALSLREKAKDLRSYLAKRLGDPEPDNPDWLHTLNNEMEDVAAALRHELHPGTRPTWKDGIEIQLSPPFVNMNLAKLSEWRKFRKMRKHIFILTELSKHAAYKALPPQALRKLLTHGKRQ